MSLYFFFPEQLPALPEVGPGAEAQLEKEKPSCYRLIGSEDYGRRIFTLLYSSGLGTPLAKEEAKNPQQASTCSKMWPELRYKEF